MRQGHRQHGTWLDRKSKAMSTADNMKCEICGNNHHPMTECRDALCSLASASCSPSSLTPETDALADEIYARGIRVSEIRMLQHARTMEKERNMARATANTFRQCAEVTFGTMPFPRKFHWENASGDAPGANEKP